MSELTEINETSIDEDDKIKIWGTKIFEYYNDKKINISELLSYNYYYDNYNVIEYNKYDLNLSWNTFSWNPSKDLVYKNIGNNNIYAPNYVKICEILEYMRTKKYRKAYIKYNDNYQFKFNKYLDLKEFINYNISNNYILKNIIIKELPNGKYELYNKNINICFYDLAKI